MKKFVLIILFLSTISTSGQCWKSISVGELHTVGIKVDNTLWSFGNGGDWGRLGAGDITQLLVPTKISTSQDWREVSGSDFHNLAIKNNGTLWSWGNNSSGQLGNNSSITKYSPTQIGNSQWKTVRAGTNHSVGIKIDGTLWAWGENEDASIGDGTFVDRFVPTLISSNTNWATVDCNLSRNIAVKTDGTLWVWGMNSPALGVEGMGSETSYITIPTKIGIDTDWKSVVSGFGYFLALKNNNTLWAWGGGGNGKLGNGSVSSIFLPTQIGIADDWSSIEANGATSYGIKLNGTIWAWGKNNNGQLGNSTQADVLVPTQIIEADDWKIASTGFFFTAAIKTDGSLYTWGSNAFGTLGDGTYIDQLSPKLINTCTLGTEDFGNTSKVKLYPNPVQNNLFLDIQETQQYQIHSVLGVKVSEGQVSSDIGIDCSSLNSGVYFISLRDSFGKSSTLKFVKQ